MTKQPNRCGYCLELLTKHRGKILYKCEDAHGYNVYYDHYTFVANFRFNRIITKSSQYSYLYDDNNRFIFVSGVAESISNKIRYLKNQIEYNKNEIKDLQEQIKEIENRYTNIPLK